MTRIGAMLAVGVSALLLVATSVLAEPAIIYDIGGKFDKSFNESAYTGAESWKAKTGSEYREIEIQSEAQREQAIRRLASGGSNPIVMTGFSFQSILSAVAPDFPDTKFTIIDSVVDQPNVRSVVFSEHEGSYLVGVIAGLTTKSNIVGFVGGMDVPLIRRFACGYVQGVKDVNADAQIIQQMTGNDPSAWNDPVKGSEITKSQIASGADIVYHAAGGTGVGVLQAAHDAGILGIGVDSNQNHLHPGSVLTSMIKRVSVAVEDAFSGGADAPAGVYVLGVAEDGVGYSMDEHNAPLISEEVMMAVEARRDAIIDGSLSVHNYTTDDSCPAS
ncbi:MAG: BMP family ABC transporter substrate-binding protein [Rhodobacteraceae bacterium]|nr:BMP family ABC transporter substrate-binding protein [Paracoccaceae bacterium]